LETNEHENVRITEAKRSSPNVGINYRKIGCEGMKSASG
jgi:hypothetical protein